MGCTGGQLLNAFDRATRALKTLSAGNRTLLRATQECQLLSDMCHVIVEQGSYCRAGVAYADQSPAKRIDWRVLIGLQGAEARPVDLTWFRNVGFTWDDTSRGQSAAGVAIRTRSPCVGRNILTNPAYAHPDLLPLRQQAIAGGFAAVTALPLQYGEHLLGALFITAAEPDAFDDEEMRLLGELADDLAYGICALRTSEQNRQAQATIERLAFFDTHTGLPNRTRLLQLLEQGCSEARASGTALSFLHVDVGRLQHINQVLGARAGDSLIGELARRLAQALPASQPLARQGESCFGVVLPGHDAAQAMVVARRLLYVLDPPAEVCGGVMIDASIQVGIAPYARPDMTAETLLRHAHAALLQASAGNRRCAVYDSAGEQESAMRLALMGELRHAVERRELLLYCQPKAEIRTGRVTGAEALVRWAHPRRGLILPGMFIKLAEQSGMISLVTNWLLEAAFAQAALWRQAGLSKSLAINLSAYDLYDADLVPRIEQLFATSGVPARLIQFELTESALIDEPVTALEGLARLKRLGVELLIDDYGTGYSSLSYLQRFPIDAIKIDQSFVMPMVRSANSEMIVRSTIELAHDLKLKVVAEGVEDEALWRSLDAHGCDVAQGYFLGQPMPAMDFLEWEQAWRTRQHAGVRAAPPRH